MTAKFTNEVRRRDNIASFHVCSDYSLTMEGKKGKRQERRTTHYGVRVEFDGKRIVSVGMLTSAPYRP